MSVSDAVLTQILTQLEALQVSQQTLQAKVRGARLYLLRRDGQTTYEQGNCVAGRVDHVAHYERAVHTRAPCYAYLKCRPGRRCDGERGTYCVAAWHLCDTFNVACR